MTTFSQSSPRLSTLDVRHHWPVFLLLVPFLASVFGAYIWFNTDIGRSGSRPSTLDSRPRIWLSARTNIPGYTFIPEPVSDSVKKTLGTTNILSGTFVRDTESRKSNDDRRVSPETTLDPRLSTFDTSLPSRITVFLATWTKNEARGLTAILHTPDICWGGVGWKRLVSGVPSCLDISLFVGQGLKEVPFECRLFESPVAGRRELVVYCALIRNSVLNELLHMRAKPGNWSGNGEPIRRVDLKQFDHILRNRLSASLGQQFVRFSVSVPFGGSSTLEEIRSFGSLWLEAMAL